MSKERKSHLVVAGDGDVDVAQRGINIAQGNDRDVDIRSFNDGLVVGMGVHDDQETGLTESSLDLISESTGGETSGNRCGLGVRGELEDSPLALGTRRDDENIGRVVDGDDGTRSQKQLFISAAQVDDVDT